MMLADPWDVKHEIEEKQKQLYNMKLMKGQQNSSTNQREKQSQINILDSKFSQDISEHHEKEEQHSDENSIQETNNSHYAPKLSAIQDSSADLQLFQLQKGNGSRKKYGSMIVCCQGKNYLLSLGPNYLFFFFAYLCFTIATIYLVGLANHALENTYFKIFNFAFCWLQNLSYILVALSNPGIQVPQTDVLVTQEDLKNNRYCKKCGALQLRKTYHCRQCDVCINDYDHHCPWTSKCIGGGNLKRFYFFVCMTPFYIFYYMVVFMICMASITVHYNKNLKSQPPTF